MAGTGDLATNKLKVFIDGTKVGEVNIVDWNTNSPSYNWFIGRKGGVYTSSPFNGDMEDFRLYNRALSEAEIQTLYNSTKPPDSTSPVISPVTASNITTSTAVITWTTDENSTSLVEYGPTTAYGQVASVAGSVTNHSVPLAGLASATRYCYRTRSADSVGNEVFSAQTLRTHSATRGNAWVQATANAAFSNRYAFPVVAFNNKLWVIGGGDVEFFNDVWSSSDGVTWTQATSSAGFSPRGGAQSPAPQPMGGRWSHPGI